MAQEFVRRLTNMLGEAAVGSKHMPARFLQDDLFNFNLGISKHSWSK